MKDRLTGAQGPYLSQPALSLSSPQAAKLSTPAGGRAEAGVEVAVTARLWHQDRAD